MLREGRDDDAEAYIRLIGDAWAEFPGVIFDVDGELPELRGLATHFATLDGALWLAEDGRGMIATRPLREDQAWEIGRMYVAKSARGTGLAQRLLATAEAHARAAGAERMILWTDTRFEAAHAFYEKAGYVRQGAIRILDDLSKSLEFRYAKPSRGLVVEMLDAAAAAGARNPAPPGSASPPMSPRAIACCWPPGWRASSPAPSSSTSRPPRTSRTAPKWPSSWWTPNSAARAWARP